MVAIVVEFRGTVRTFDCGGMINATKTQDMLDSPLAEILRRYFLNAKRENSLSSSFFCDVTFRRGLFLVPSFLCLQ
jgi:hypothetical protein